MEVGSSGGKRHLLGTQESSFSSSSLATAFWLVLLCKFIDCFVPWFIHLEQCFSTGEDFCPPKDTWQCLKTFLVVMTREGKVALVASRG